MDEITLYLALTELGVTLQPGESATAALLRTLRAADPLLRPYRYDQVDGMRMAFGAWWSTWPQRALYTLPGGYVSPDIAAAYQAGYTARDRRTAPA